ncbi:MAG: acyltransferase family protein, partial [Lachnospiraceae bacterium]|nr:acyltransferase family protein [Lachnospiraceae bacterium]
MKHKQYDILADLLKGIGIISVVIGHSGGFIPTKLGSSVTAFVYLYHLMVFFFVAGMTFHPKKYPDPYVYIGRQLKSTAPLFIGYNLLFLAAHNLFARFHVVDIEPFTKNDFIIQGISIFAFKYTEVLTGALWFVPMFLFSRSLFAI